MSVSFAYIGAYVLLVGVASFVESPVGRGFSAFQLNALIRIGGLVVGIVALVAVHGLAFPSSLPLLAGLGIGIIDGVGSICYCLALDYLTVSVVVACANLYLVVTVLLGIAILHEAITAWKIAGLVLTLTGVLFLSYTPGRFGVDAEKGDTEMYLRVLPFAIMAAYVVLIGVGAFLEKPALRALDATQLNGLQAVGMVIVASVALLARGDGLRPSRHALVGGLVGIMIGLGSIAYFLGLQQLPVSVAAAVSNAYMVVTVLLSIVVLHEVLPWAKWIGIALTLAGVTLLAYGAG